MTIVIAEIGENHCGDMDIARQLIDVAKRAGADYVKFQLYDASKVSKDDPEREWFKKVQLSDNDFFDLVSYSRKKNIKSLCTPWDVEKAKLIFKIGINNIKIASFHITKFQLLSVINKKAERVFLSTGMCTMEEIEKAVNMLNDVEELFLLHCVSEYPLPPENVNLRCIDTLKSRFGNRVKIGYSDHTKDIVAPIAAVARGAEVIEKHITLDKSFEGTDHILSATPEELTEMIRQIHLIEKMMGTGAKELTKIEAENQKFLRERFDY